MIEQGIKLGIVTAIKIAFAYSLMWIIALSITFVFNSPDSIFFTFSEFIPFVLFVTLIVGILPAMGVGALGGALVGIIYKYKQTAFFQSNAIIIGCLIGVLLVLLVHLLLWPTITSDSRSQLTLRDAIQDYLSSWWIFLTLPGVITIFVFGWISQKLNRHLLVQNKKGPP